MIRRGQHDHADSKLHYAIVHGERVRCRVSGVGSSLLLHFRKSFTRFAADELGDAFVLVHDFSRRAVEDDLRFVGLQPAERVKHHDAIGHLLGSLHIVRHDDARHRVRFACG